MFESSWKRCWQSIGAEGTGTALMHQLLEAYREPQRKYHTEQHLKECLTLFDQHIDLAIEPGEIEIALWFHDAAYNIKASNNEALSAEWAVNELNRAKVPPDRVSRVRDHILATTHSALPQGPDQQLMIDIDLSILGAKHARFDEYERQIRQEYRVVPGLIFKQKRKQILTSFLARKPIYTTPIIRDKFEEQARQNISRSISALAAS